MALGSHGYAILIIGLSDHAAGTGSFHDAPPPRRPSALRLDMAQLSVPVIHVQVWGLRPHCSVHVHHFVYVNSSNQTDFRVCPFVSVNALRLCLHYRSWKQTHPKSYNLYNWTWPLAHDHSSLKSSTPLSMYVVKEEIPLSLKQNGVFELLYNRVSLMPKGVFLKWLEPE
jgi:hypothetical protein